jgi:hypothetical protein
MFDFIRSRTFLDNLLSVNRYAPSWGECQAGCTSGNPLR